MVEKFHYSVSTILPKAQVWPIFADALNWPRVSDLYVGAKWLGVPWKTGSCLRAELRRPEHISLSYVIESCVPGVVVRYIAYGEVLGFAAQREISFYENKGSTEICTSAYCVGSPVRPFPQGAMGFLKAFTTEWYQALSRFCDQQALIGGEAGIEKLMQKDNMPGSPYDRSGAT